VQVLRGSWGQANWACLLHIIQMVRAGLPAGRLTMFQSLLRSDHAYRRHCEGPLAVERERYLRHCADRGATISTLRVKSNSCCGQSACFHRRPRWAWGWMSCSPPPASGCRFTMDARPGRDLSMSPDRGYGISGGGANPNPTFPFKANLMDMSRGCATNAALAHLRLWSGSARLGRFF
jgi:hypothetical protein